MILDNLKNIHRYDSARVLPSVELILEQFRAAVQGASLLPVPADFKKVKNIVLNGMGGSALNGDILRFLCNTELRVPFIVTNSYQVPEFVNKETLYIASSYSGTTEETITAVKLAKKRGAKILGITAGGTLIKWLEDNHLPYYKIDQQYNPCHQPRVGVGSAIGGVFGALASCGLIKINQQEISRELVAADQWGKLFGVNNQTKSNPAKQLAEKINGKIPFIVAAEFLSGNAHVIANQINETAKNMAGYFLISELNHHLLEGLTFPRSNARNICFWLINSSLYCSRNQVRLKITERVIKKNKVKAFIYNCGSPTKFGQMLEVLLLGSYTSLYLSVLHNVDPSLIPWVDYFKEELAKEE